MDYSIRDKAYYARFYNKKGVKVTDDRLVYAFSKEQAEQVVRDNLHDMPKHHRFEISEYYGENSPIENE